MAITSTIMRQIEPCPVCNTPRVGYDSDDHFVARPGRLIPAEPGTCEFQGFSQEYPLMQWRWRDSRQAAAQLGHNAWKVEKEEITVCPICGAQTVLSEEEGGKWPCAYKRGIRHCPNHLGARKHVEPLPGCPDCHSGALWSGFGLHSNDD
jgi:ssDNA-binding Zn-finger/Zn-ribbon topoisomerase 1